jgi:hypothetical protein
VAADVGDGGAERVVLQPVHVEGLDRHAGDRLLGVADRHVTAADPYAEAGAIVVMWDWIGAARALRWSRCRDRPAVQVDIERRTP